MRSGPILYSSAMVVAKRAGRKRMTRRLMTPQPEWKRDLNCYGAEMWRQRHATVYADGLWSTYDAQGGAGERGQSVSVEQAQTDALNAAVRQGFIRCPYGKPGDHLWTQENYRLSGLDGLDAALAADTGLTATCRYLADGEEREVQLTPADVRKLAARRTVRTRPMPGRFMYESCSRDTDVLTAVRCERLQDITEADALAEGICQIANTCYSGGEHIEYGYHADPFAPRGVQRSTAVEAFRNLWEGIHGEASWNASPWVWVLSYEPLEPAR